MVTQFEVASEPIQPSAFLQSPSVAPIALGLMRSGLLRLHPVARYLLRRFHGSSVARRRARASSRRIVSICTSVGSSGSIAPRCTWGSSLDSASSPDRLTSSWYSAAVQRRRSPPLMNAYGGGTGREAEPSSTRRLSRPPQAVLVRCRPTGTRGPVARRSAPGPGPEAARAAEAEGRLGLAARRGLARTEALSERHEGIAGRNAAWFMAMFAEAMGCGPQDLVTRIKFEYLEAEASLGGGEPCWCGVGWGE